MNKNHKNMVFDILIIGVCASVIIGQIALIVLQVAHVIAISAWLVFLPAIIVGALVAGFFIWMGIYAWIGFGSYGGGRR